jgi:trehalose synthase
VTPRSLDAYAEAAGPEVIDHLRQLARPLAGKTVVHVNSTREGGGVAEILMCLIPLKRELGIDASWEVVRGTPEFFGATKGFHNGLQGQPVAHSRKIEEVYEEVNRDNAKRLRPVLEAADFVFIHDPQPAPLLRFCPNRRGKWIWRCHVDVSRPYRAVWKYLRGFVAGYDASIFSLAAFAQPLPHNQYLIPPSIDPLAEKNIELDPEEVRGTAERFGIDPQRPLVLQVSRFDRFKDPVGVIRAYTLVKAHLPLQLVLAGGAATDDPEGAAILDDVRREAGDDPDIHVLLLPADSHRAINTLQRRADLVLQKSVREGFGLTVTEALWKKKPVIGGRTGGITLQVIDYHTGFLVSTPEGAAFRIRYLLNRPDTIESMGEKGRRLVRENFLLTRHLREYLTLMVGLLHGAQDRIEIG